MNKYNLIYLVKAFSEWGKAKMVRFEVLNVHGMSTVSGYWSNPSRRHVISLGNYLPAGRTTPTTTVSSAAIRGIAASFASGCTPVRPVALSRLSLIKYLGNHKLAFFLFFVLTQVVLVHHPVGLFGFSVFPEICVED